MTLLDWESAFCKVDHSLGMQAFIDCGVRPSLLPIIANYFEDRSMTVQWHNIFSSSYDLPGSTPQGSSFLLEYIALTNDNTDCVPQENKFKYTIRSIVCEASCHPVTWSLGHLVTWSLGHSVTRSLGHSVTRSLGHSVTWSFGHLHSVTRSLVTWSLGHLVTWSLGL